MKILSTTELRCSGTSRSSFPFQTANVLQNAAECIKCICEDNCIENKCNAVLSDDLNDVRVLNNATRSLTPSSLNLRRYATVFHCLLFSYTLSIIRNYFKIVRFVRKKWISFLLRTIFFHVVVIIERVW